MRYLAPLVFLLSVCAPELCPADALPVLNGPATTLAASPKGKALCPFVIKNPSGSVVGTMDCGGQFTALDSLVLQGGGTFGYSAVIGTWANGIYLLSDPLLSTIVQAQQGSFSLMTTPTFPDGGGPATNASNYVQLGIDIRGARP